MPSAMKLFDDLPEAAIPIVAPPADTASENTPLRAPAEARRRLEKLRNKREDRVDRSRKLASQFEELHRYLSIADKVTGALELLSEQLFQQLLGVVQDKLSIALQEILDQPIQ